MRKPKEMAQGSVVNARRPLRMGIIIGAFLTFSTGSAFSQDNTIDSLQRRLLDVTGEQRFDVLIELAYNYADVHNDNEKALRYIEKTYSLMNAVKDSLKIVKTLRAHGQLLNRLTRYQESKAIFSISLKIAKRNNYSTEIKKILNSLAIATTFLADYEEALRYHFESLQINKEENDLNGMGITLNNVGLIYYKLRNYVKALEFYNQSLELKLRTGNHFDLDRLYLNMGICYKELKQPEEALRLIEKGLSTCVPNCSDAVKVEAQFAFGYIFQDRNERRKAKEYFVRSLDLANLLNLCRIERASGRYAIAEKYLREAEATGMHGLFNELLLDIYREYIGLYKLKRDYRNLAVYQSRYIFLKEEIHSEQRIARIAELQTDFQERERLQTIAYQKKIMAFQKSILVRQRYLNIGISVCVLLFMLVGVLLLKSNRDRRNRNHLLETKVRERTMELEVSQENLLCEYEGLKYHARSVSTSIISALSTLKGISHLATQEAKDTKLQQYFKQLCTVTDYLIHEARNLRISSFE
jgi:tetratricopeptide (TPR) repeat protein